MLIPATAAIMILLSVMMQQTATATATATFTFLNQSSFIGEDKIMHVFGEMKNESNVPMKEILITASFYDKNGTLLSQFQRSPELRVINPSGVAPLEMLFLDSASVSNIANYSLSAVGHPADTKEKGIKIVSSNQRLDVLGLYYISVMARNEGSETATNSIMIATLYDKDGKVVAIGKALAEAGAGSSDLAPGQEAGFGIVVSERLQTYKVVRYSLVADSDQYTSDVITLPFVGLGANTITNVTNSAGQKSGCLIATAAFGSDLAPQVQQLRTFRDSVVLKTLAGSSFMNAFNGWYYSFSPSVADYERDTSWLKSAVRASVYPLLSILDLSTLVYHSLGFNSEVAILGAGLTASSLIGAFYFAPLSAVLVIAAKKNNWKMSNAKYPLIVGWIVSTAAIAGGEMSTSTELLMLGTALLVLTVISTVMLAIVRTLR